jgi:hypothetical protein
MDDLTALARLIEALRPWHNELVIVGGWAHRLYRFHPGASEPSYLPLRTRDADVAFSDRRPPSGDIGAALKAAGFQESFFGESRPPVIHYQLGEEDQGFYAEFLVPLHGPGSKKDGAPHSTVARAGVIAQKLRYLDLLLMYPWSVDLQPNDQMPLAAPATILLPNPVTFIAQRILIRTRRDSDKQAQDVLYIHDTLELFGHDLDVLRDLWTSTVRRELTSKLARSVERLQQEQFRDVTDVIRNAIRIPQDRKLTPEGLRTACAYGLEAIFEAD